MLFPVHDTNTLRHIPFQRATVGLIVLNVLVFVWQQTLSSQEFVDWSYIAGIVPASLLGSAHLPAELAVLSPKLTLISYMFLHGDWLHLLGNMLFLWVFGDNVEDAMGSLKFLFFYLLCGVGGGIAHAAIAPGSEAPLIGASGAVAGVIASYLLLYPKARVWCLVLLRVPLRLPAYAILGLWIATQVYFVAIEDESGTAWWAHLGGLVAGLLLTPAFRRRGLRLFGPHAEAPASAA